MAERYDMNNLKGKKVLVFGAGISGTGAAELLGRAGADVILYDGNTSLSEEDVREKLPAGCGAKIVLGEMPADLAGTLDLVVLSPGVPTDLPVVNGLRDAGLPIWGEVELAYVCSRGDVLAITGTNGKTTTTSLLGAIMRRHQPEVFVVGNIGTPYTGAAPKMTDDSVAVAEISSFQLETTHSFHPQVSAITNITPDHLNRHHTMEEYIRVKECITMNQTPDDTCVLNYEDPVLREFGESLAAQGKVKVSFFSSARRLDDGFFYEDGRIYIAEGGKAEELIAVSELKLLGVHNYENVMTASAMAHAYGVPVDEIREVLRAFTSVEHRIEYVAEKNGVIYYNDSKGTNPDAAIRAVQAMERPTVLIGGGYDKDSSYEEWIRAFDGKVKLLVLIGATKEKIADAARACGFTDFCFADTFEEAFEKCVEAAKPGDAVLLSPACASWDMFKNFEVRGNVFKELVHRL